MCWEPTTVWGQFAQDRRVEAANSTVVSSEPMLTTVTHCQRLT
jgi:hypothetical protein